MKNTLGIVTAVTRAINCDTDSSWTIFLPGRILNPRTARGAFASNRSARCTNDLVDMATMAVAMKCRKIGLSLVQLNRPAK